MSEATPVSIFSGLKGLLKPKFSGSEFDSKWWEFRLKLEIGMALESIVRLIGH